MRWTLVLAAIAAACGGCRAEEPASHLWRLDRIATWNGQPWEVWGAPQVVDFQDGPAVTFDGEDDAIMVEANPIAGWRAFTIEVLCRPDADGSPEQRFLHIAAAEEVRLLMEIRLNPGGLWCVDTFLHSAGDQLALIDRARLHSAGSWHWVALRYDGRTMTHFVDGVQECTGEVNFPAMEGGHTSLGVRQSRNFWFKGAIREVRFHPAALADDELQGMR